MITDYIPEEVSVTASISATVRSYTGQTCDQNWNITRNVDETERRKWHIERADRVN